jgi:hypothetical protein
MPVELCSMAVDAGPLYTMQLQSATCAKRSRILVLDEAIIASHGDLPLHLRQSVLLSDAS